jgi:hypothetical protein
VKYPKKRKKYKYIFNVPSPNSSHQQLHSASSLRIPKHHLNTSNTPNFSVAANMRSFTSLPAIGALFQAATATPSQPRSETQDVNIVVQRIHSTGETDMAVTETTTSQVVGYACNNKLDTGSFSDLPITTDIDPTGAGSMAIGSTTYKIHENSVISGGITCTRMFNDVEMYMNCAASIPSSVQLTPVAAKGNICFSSTAPGMHIAANAMLTGAAPPPAGNVTKRSADSIEERQAPCGQ